ncbi:AAA family ATPase [soil metagenome]
MGHLRSIRLENSPDDVTEKHPFGVPAVRALMGKGLNFPTPVTVFVGENGSGKSTLLEGIACAVEAIAIGTNDLRSDESLFAGHALRERMRLSWDIKRNREGFFLRAEDFFGFAMRTDRMRAEYKAELEAIRADPSLSAFTKGLAAMPYESQLSALNRLYAHGLDSQSHGEAFLALFQSRIRPGGLYLLDEPEAPLSPTRQLTLLSMMRLIVEEQGAQIIMATHSPIMMAYPGATIYGFDGGSIEPVGFDNVEHISVMRAFLRDPDSFLRHL